MEFRLEEIFYLQMGKTPSRNNPDYWNSEDNKWISIADLSKCGKYIENTKEYLSDLAVEESGISCIPENTVVMSFKLSIGKTAITPEPMFSNEAIMSFRDKKIIEILPDYIYYMFSGKDWDEGTNKAVMGKTLNKATLSKIKVNIPSIEEQKSVVEVLDKVSKLIADRKAELEKLDELIKARFVELFGSIHEDKFPKCTLREVAHIKHGFAFSGEFFSEEENGIVLVTPGNFALGGGFQEVRNKYFTSDYPEEYILHAGDLIVTMTDLSKKADTLGYGAIVPDTGKVYLHNQRIGLFDQLDEKLNPVFVRWYMQTNEYRLEIVRTSTGSTVHHTSPDRILDSVIYLPPIELQNSFVRFAKQVDKSKVAVQKALDEAQLLFDSLMQKYFG